MFLQTGLLVLSLASIVHGERRILGGHNAPNHKYPYQISFRHNIVGHFCGGSIINKRWILSAAHCFQRYDINSFKISAGTNFLNESGSLYEPSLLIIHEQYQILNYYDIALVRLKRDIVFTDFVKTIRLPTEDLHDYRKTAVVAGWGLTQWMGQTPNALQEIKLNLLTLEECRKTLPRITNDHICTLNNRGEGICSGDSGGPLMMDGVQVGIASYGLVPCGDYPDAWTRVFSYRNWILRNIQYYDSIGE